MWFTEDPWPPMLLCGVGLLVGLGMWASSKRVLHLGISVVSLLLAGVIFYVEQAVVTPAEVVEQHVRHLCDEFRRKQPTALDYFSPTAPGLRAMAEGAMAMVTIGDDLSVTDFKTTITNEGSRAQCHFRANATISLTAAGNVGRQPARFLLTWAKEGDDWKVIAVKRLNPVNGSDMGMMDSKPS